MPAIDINSIPQHGGEVVRALITVGLADKWYSRRPPEQVGEATGDLEVSANPEIDIARVWWQDPDFRLNGLLTAAGDFQDYFLAGGLGEHKIVYVATPYGDITLRTDDSSHRSIGSSFINLTPDNAEREVLNQVRPGDPVNLALADARLVDEHTQDLLHAIQNDIRVHLPRLSSCAVHDGRWDLAEVKRWSNRTPTALIAWLGTTRTDTPGVAWTDCEQQLAVTIMTRDQGNLPRGVAARNLVDSLLLYIPRARWGLGGVGQATDLRAQNLYSGQIDKHGVAMWTVMWRQMLRLEALEDGACPPLPEELYSSAREDPHVEIYPDEGG